MQKRHYELIAAAIRQCLIDPPASPEAYAARLVNRLSADLRSTNPRFNPERFERACKGSKGSK